eukprot:scaffold10939_cov117-Isochrysis_galbana.AAC.1
MGFNQRVQASSAGPGWGGYGVWGGWWGEWRVLSGERLPVVGGHVTYVTCDGMCVCVVGGGGGGECGQAVRSSVRRFFICARYGAEGATGMRANSNKFLAIPMGSLKDAPNPPDFGPRGAKVRILEPDKSPTS